MASLTLTPFAFVVDLGHLGIRNTRKRLVDSHLSLQGNPWWQLFLSLGDFIARWNIFCHWGKTIISKRLWLIGRVLKLLLSLMGIANKL
jgi:hypothetical protein